MGSSAKNPLQETTASAMASVGLVQRNRLGFRGGGPKTTTSGAQSTRTKTGCWTCGEPHYQCGFPVQRAKAAKSTGHTIIVNMGKAHRIHDHDE
jgi:hypothetical protein